MKQGGVLSPILFSIYFDELLYKLGVGCHIGDTFVGALAYPDDVVLLAPTKTAADIMLNVADKFANEYNVNFNACKTKHVLFNANDECVNVNFNNIKIESIPSECHLGNIVGRD